jgi:hypothetical protein
LLSRAELIQPILEKRGLSLKMDLLNDRHRSLAQSMGKGQSSHAALARGLSGVLDELDELLEDRKAS